VKGREEERNSKVRRRTPIGGGNNIVVVGKKFLRGRGICLSPFGEREARLKSGNKGRE